MNNHQPWHGNREEIFAAMRKLGDANERNWKQAREIGPRQGMLSVGGADFDYTLKAIIGNEYLRQIRFGKTPDEAHMTAAESGREAVKKWNKYGTKSRVKIGHKHELDRWEGAGDSEADAIHRKFLMEIGPCDSTNAIK